VERGKGRKVQREREREAVDQEERKTEKIIWLFDGNQVKNRLWQVIDTSWASVIASDCNWKEMNCHKSHVT